MKQCNNVAMKQCSNVKKGGGQNGKDKEEIDWLVNRGARRNMKGLSKRWLEFAKDDLKAASILFANKSYRECIYHCHQALEKTIKAGIVQKGQNVRKTHDLAGLINDSGLSIPDAILQFIEKINPHYIPIRYPDATMKWRLKYTKTTAKKFLETTKETFKWLQLQLMQLK